MNPAEIIPEYSAQNSDMHTGTINVKHIINQLADARSTTAFSHYLMMKAQLAGILRFDGHKASEEEMAVTGQCRALYDRIAKMLSVCKECDILDLLECYDIMCRIGHKRLPDSTFVNRHKHRVLKAWEAGDRSVQESSVFGITVSDMSYHPKDADREYVEAYLSIKRKWVDTLMKHDYFPEVSAYENYQRLALIMRENIDRELGISAACDGSCRHVVTAGEMKRRWYEHNRVGDLSTLGSQILRSYRRFIGSLFPAVIDFDTKMDLDNRILSELATRTGLDPYDREAFRMALEFNKELSDD